MCMQLSHVDLDSNSLGDHGALLVAEAPVTAIHVTARYIHMHRQHYALTPLFIFLPECQALEEVLQSPPLDILLCLHYSSSS